jgi:hypothetical protein
MKWLLVGIVVAVAAIIVLRLRVPAAEKSGMSKATLADLPAMVALLDSVRTEGSFLALGADSVPGLNVQFSFEDGSVGFDWVLLAPINIEQREKAESYAASRGQKLVEHSMNDVAYLRTTAGDLAALCHGILHELYGVRTNEELWVAVGGVEWPP